MHTPPVVSGFRKETKVISELAVSLAHLENGEQDLKDIIDLSVEFFRVDDMHFRGIKKNFRKEKDLDHLLPCPTIKRLSTNFQKRKNMHLNKIQNAMYTNIRSQQQICA